jgi:hypothetical protein
MTELIDQVSGVIETYCNRPFYRAQFVEEQIMSKPTSTRAVLSRLPVVQLDQVTYYGSVQPISDFAIQNANAGFVYHAGGFGKVTTTNDWVFTYKAGYLLPGDDFSGDTITVNASGKTYTDSGAGFPPALAPGDTFITSDASEALNNGRKTVVTATTSVITVSETLADESPGATVAMAFRNLPEAVERAAIDEVKTSYQTRKTDPTLSGLTVGPVAAKYATGTSSSKSSGGSSLPSQLGKYRVHM